MFPAGRTSTSAYTACRHTMLKVPEITVTARRPDAVRGDIVVRGTSTDGEGNGFAHRTLDDRSLLRRPRSCSLTGVNRSPKVTTEKLR